MILPYITKADDGDILFEWIYPHLRFGFFICTSSLHESGWWFVLKRNNTFDVLRAGYLFHIYHWIMTR